MIPHRGVQWLFDLDGNLQTLCKSHHTKKTMAERGMPIDTMYPIDLPEPPHYRPTRLVCGPAPVRLELETSRGGYVILYEDRPGEDGWPVLGAELARHTPDPLVLAVPAPRTAERAFWSHVMDCEAELITPPIEYLAQGEPKAWWADFMLDGRAEEAMRRRRG